MVLDYAENIIQLLANLISLLLCLFDVRIHKHRASRTQIDRSRREECERSEFLGITSE